MQVLSGDSSRGALLTQKTFNAGFTQSSESETDVAINGWHLPESEDWQRVDWVAVAPGGIDLLPLPGRYLSAPTDHVTLRLQLGAQGTARCAAPNWDKLHKGCFANTTFTNAYVGAAGDAVSFDHGFSLERCARYCSSAGASPAPVAFAAVVDICMCLSASNLPSQENSSANWMCAATCSGAGGGASEGSQLCGNAGGSLSVQGLDSESATPWQMSTCYPLRSPPLAPIYLAAQSAWARRPS